MKKGFGIFFIVVACLLVLLQIIVGPPATAGGSIGGVYGVSLSIGYYLPAIIGIVLLCIGIKMVKQ